MSGNTTQILRSARAGRWLRLDLRWKILGLIAACLALLASILLVAFRLQARNVLRGELMLLVAAVSFIVCMAIAYSIARMITAPLERLSSAAAGIARGDLVQEIDAGGGDEIGNLAVSFKTLADGLRGMLTDLRDASTQVETEANSILRAVTQQSFRSTEQTSALSRTSTTVNEIAQTAKQASGHADNVIKITQKSEELSHQGQRVIRESMSGMEKLVEQVKAIAVTITDLSDRTTQIGDIIATVRDLAEQSNLLALNASLEAVRAGEHGRGFAVVALEMRNLAEQSKVAAGQVHAIVSEVQNGTQAAVAVTEEGTKRARSAIALANGAADAIEGLAQVIRESSLAARQIANNTRQQTVGVEQIVSAIDELSSGMVDRVEGSRQIEEVTGSLTALSKRLSQIVSRYRV
jgi:methyl-accepting chemotaxis protein